MAEGNNAEFKTLNLDDVVNGTIVPIDQAVQKFAEYLFPKVHEGIRRCSADNADKLFSGVNTKMEIGELIIPLVDYPSGIPVVEFNKVVCHESALEIIRRFPKANGRYTMHHRFTQNEKRGVFMHFYMRRA